jgi:chromosomal replication initiation ATPase DnaA
LDEHPGGGRLSVADIWRATLGQLRLQLNQATYQAWVEGAQAIAYHDGALTVQVRTDASREWLATRLAPVIERTLASLAGQPVAVRYVVKGSDGAAKSAKKRSKAAKDETKDDKKRGAS